jgi:hypothetical protein
MWNISNTIIAVIGESCRLKSESKRGESKLKTGAAMQHTAPNGIAAASPHKNLRSSASICGQVDLQINTDSWRKGG